MRGWTQHMPDALRCLFSSLAASAAALFRSGVWYSLDNLTEGDVRAGDAQHLPAHEVLLPGAGWLRLGWGYGAGSGPCC